MDSITHKPPLVMVVDDQATMRFFASEVLSQAGFEVVEAENGLQALEFFQQLSPDCILLDVMMPELDGFSACERIRTLQQGAHVPVMMMTGMEDEDAIIRAYDVGATDFISKPISRIILPHRIRYMLRAKQTADKLRESETRLADAQRLAKLGNWQWNMKEQYMHCSEVCRQVLGLPTNKYQGQYELLLDAVLGRDKSLVRQAIDEAIRTRQVVSIEHTVLSSDAELVVYHAVKASFDENDRVVCINGTVQDITDRKRAEERIRSLAYRDQLTGLSNRTYLREFLANALYQAQREQDSLALLYLDLDRFKRINDTLGHSAGDQLLREVATRLKDCIRRGTDALSRPGGEGVAVTSNALTSSIARLGGDEFIIVLNRLQNVTDAAQVAKRIIAALSEPFLLEGHEVFVTASIGITLYPGDGKDEETLLKNADLAMYHAKDNGRDNYQFFEDSLNATVVERLSLENSLRKATEREEFVLHYQPKFDLQRGRVIGMEALIRWRHELKGEVGPDKFIPFAEESGLIVAIGYWVLKTACQQNKAWQQAGFPKVRVAVNLSARQFKEKNLVAEIAQILNDTQLEAKYLELEITEGLLMEDVVSAQKVLDQLKTMGICISVDDFGTGYSSLSYLKRFPIDILKIDRSFIKDLNTDKDNQAITKAIISMAHSLHLEVVAEGVETLEQVSQLRSYGCDEIQGYVISPPVRAEEFIELLQQHDDKLRDFWQLARQMTKSVA